MVLKSSIGYFPYFKITNLTDDTRLFRAAADDPMEQTFFHRQSFNPQFTKLLVLCQVKHFLVLFLRAGLLFSVFGGKLALQTTGAQRL
jgi:hypothetical protein